MLTYFTYVKYFLICTILAYCTPANAQIGINTTTPNGILDITSTTQGVVLPRIPLTASNTMAPVANPQGGTIPTGTVIYNTNTTSTGTNDVSEGIYVWDGTKWTPQFVKKQSSHFEQTIMNMRMESNEGYRNIPLTSSTFNAKYSGYYKIETLVNYGGGDAKNPKTSGGSSGSRSNGELNIALQTGTFRLTFNGTNYYIPANSYSTAYKDATNYFGIWKQFKLVTYVYLRAGSSPNLSLAFDQDDAPEFINEGNDNNYDGQFDGGDGHVGFDIPCSIEITYLNE
ncbi:hypothetical protein [Ulvibacter litoralis]|uniref:Uncharacterized protein n=1 Tax=Ulvibacter litoralis TaxID=227084 RepID=A0A1G7GD49_9FLAO|nr:hypothetical protein [Ulvibacter litoralis]GHC56696.1 hypothetical protein GCM10008083_21600 [Ulvibacter litoralis]SDE86054.1 hypothetical protein SAMN05421855_10359 [Ulvibacter litoralis]